jgi:hypothetical protein
MTFRILPRSEMGGLWEQSGEFKYGLDCVNSVMDGLY